MKHGKKILSSALAVMLCLSFVGVPAFAVEDAVEAPAASEQPVVVDQQGAPDSSDGQAVAADDQADAKAPAAADEQPAANAEQTKPAESMPAETDPAQSEIVEEKAVDADAKALTVEEAIEFVYIDQTIVSLGDEQNIAFGLANGVQIEEATLVLSRTDTGEKLTYQAAAIVEDAALFTFTFEGEADLAAYELDSIGYKSEGVSYVVTFTPDQVASVDVTEEGEAVVEGGATDGSASPYAFDVVRPQLADAIDQAPVSSDEIVAYSVDEEGELTAHATVEEALEAADEGGQAANDYHEGLVEEGIEEPAEQATTSPVDWALSLVEPEKAYAAGSGVFVVGLDPGHGAGDPGASGYGLLEKDVNWKIAVYCQAELNTYHNVTAVLSRSENECPGLSERVDRLVAAGAKVVVSLHNNASGSGAGHGSEVWVPNDASYFYQETHVVGEQLGTKILDRITALGLTRRGVKTRDAVTAGYSYDDTHYADGSLADYYTVIDTARRYGIPGIIVEHAFIDNASDASFLASDANLKKLGVADAQGIAAQYGLTKNGAGESYLIMGDSQTTVAQMASWYKSMGKTYPSSTYAKYGAATIDEFCQILYEEAATEGVRAEVVFTQAMLETGWLQFGGDVKPTQCNFCGLGATGGGVGGADFSSYGSNGVRMGLRAQVQHLKAYASTDNLVNSRIDPRFTYVTRGCAPRVDDLSGKWAASTTYGTNIKQLMDKLLAHKVSSAGTTVTITKAAMKNATSVYVDGIEYPIKWQGNGTATITLPDTSRKVLQVYTFNTTSTDLEKVYPTHMYVWFLKYGNGGYVLNRAEDFDDVMQYAGSSIRVSGKKGIRMITAVPLEKKTLLAANGMDGYTLQEYGTVVARDSKLNGASLTLSTSGAASNYAFKRGVIDPVFKTTNGTALYTNVLVGFSTSECKQVLTMRSYMKLKVPSGNEVVLYGGPVHRSIGYIAYQNKNAFGSSTSAYAYVWDIIHAVYGADAK